MSPRYPKLPLIVRCPYCDYYSASPHARTNTIAHIRTAHPDKPNLPDLPGRHDHTPRPKR
jgi:hypothetical protein